MKGFVLVEFVAGYPDESDLLFLKLKDLGNDFVTIKEEDDYAEDDFGSQTDWVTVTGMISSECATVIKLRDKFLSERMNISYIPESLKDKYRK